MSWLRRKSPQDRFADEVAGMARSLLGARVRRVPDDFALEVALEDGRTSTMYLDNVHRETERLEGEERDVRLRTALLALAAPPRPRTWEEAAPQLLPGVRSASWAAASSADVVRRPLLPFVSLLCAVDSEHAMSFAAADDLSAWGVGEQEALDRAVQNLVSQPVEVATTPDGAAHVTGPDGYASSWLAVPDVLLEVAEAVLGGSGGTVVAVAPTRDDLVLLDVDSATAVTALETALADYEAAPRQLSAVPYVVDGGPLRPWQPPAGHPAAEVVDRAVHLLAAVEYGQQRARLEELFTQIGEDVYVAPCSLARGPDGVLWSWTLWVRQVDDGLVPQADHVMFADNDDSSSFAVAWADVVRVAGAHLQPAGYDPPLWRVTGWPDDATVAQLRSLARDPGAGGA